MWFWIVWSINVTLMCFSWWSLDKKGSPDTHGAGGCLFVWLLLGGGWTAIATFGPDAETASRCTGAQIVIWIPYVIGSFCTYLFTSCVVKFDEALSRLVTFMGRLW